MPVGNTAVATSTPAAIPYHTLAPIAAAALTSRVAPAASVVERHEPAPEHTLRRFLPVATGSVVERELPVSRTSRREYAAPREVALLRAPYSSGSDSYHSVGSAFDSDASLSSVGSDRLAAEDWSSSEEENAEIARLTDRLVRSDSPEGREINYKAWSDYLEERKKPGLLARAMRRGGTGLGWAVQRLGAHGIDSGIRLLAESASQNFAEAVTQFFTGGPTWAGRAGEYVGEGASTMLQSAGVPASIAAGAGWVVSGVTRAAARTQTAERVVSSVSDAVVGTALGATASTLRNYVSPPPRIGHGTNLYVGQPFANAQDREAEVQAAVDAAIAPTDPLDREVVEPAPRPKKVSKRLVATTRSSRNVKRPSKYGFDPPTSSSSSADDAPPPPPPTPKKGRKKGSGKGKDRAE